MNIFSHADRKNGVNIRTWASDESGNILWTMDTSGFGMSHFYVRDASGQLIGQMERFRFRKSHAPIHLHGQFLGNLRFLYHHSTAPVYDIDPIGYIMLVV